MLILKRPILVKTYESRKDFEKMAHPNKGAAKRDAPKMGKGPLEVKKKRSDLIDPDLYRKNRGLCNPHTLIEDYG
jgi:hypothetical protein